MKIHIAGSIPGSASFNALKDAVESLGHEATWLRRMFIAGKPDSLGFRFASGEISTCDAVLVPADVAGLWPASFELTMAFTFKLPIYAVHDGMQPSEDFGDFSIISNLSLEPVSLAGLEDAIGRKPAAAATDGLPAFPFSVVSPSREVDAYEAIWAEQSGRSLYAVSRLLKGRRPSQYHADLPSDVRALLGEKLAGGKIHSHPVIVRGTREFPSDPRCRFPLLYCRGDLAMIDLRSVCVTAYSAEQRQIDETADILVGNGLALVSGLERAGDRAIIQSVLDRGGRVIAVSGRPLTYARKGLEADLAKKNLVVSHVPYFQYLRQTRQMNRMFTHEMNAVMATLSRFSVILGPEFDQGHRILASESSRLSKSTWLCGDNEKNIYFLPYSDVRVTEETVGIDFTEAER